MKIKIKNTEYFISHWQKYRKTLDMVDGKLVFPNFGKIVSWNSSDMWIGLELVNSHKEYRCNIEKCRWKVVGEMDFNFIPEWFKLKSGSIYISHNEIESSQIKIDNILMKFNDLKVYL